MKKEYPKWIYKAGEAKIVTTPEEHDKHKGWKETPTAEAQAPKPKRGNKK